MSASTVYATVATPGPPGPAGYSPQFIVGVGAPSNATGNNGDMYINSATGDVYGPKTGGNWGAIAVNIKGPIGSTGATGPAGYSPQYIVAAGAPTSGIGNVGDMYINSTTSDVYGPKTPPGWGPIVCNIKGSTGTQGPPGVGYNPRGAWAAPTTYAQGDQVTDGTSLYISLQSSNTGHQPSTSPTYWQPVAAGGAGSQTPWTSDIDAAGFTLKNAGKVGVGVAAPSSPVQVHVGTDQNLAIRSFIGMASLSAYNDANSAAAPMNLDASKFVISTGNVGIGTQTPISKLSLGGSANVSNRIALCESQPDDSDFRGIGMANPGGSTYGIALWANKIPSNTNPDVFIKDGGNVGIGTSNPQGLLQVGANSYNTYDTDTVILPANVRFAGYSSTFPMCFIAAQDNSGSNSLGIRFRVQNAGANVEAVHISSVGSMGIGSTSPGGTYGQLPAGTTPSLDIVSTANADANLLRVIVQPTAPGAYKSGIVFGANDTNTANQSFNAARIYGVFDGNAYNAARFTIATPTGSGAWTDVLTCKNGQVGIGASALSPVDWLYIRPASGSGKAGLTVRHVGNSADETTITALHASSGYGWRQRVYDTDGSFILDVQSGGAWTSNALVVKASNGNVGIAQTSPQCRLTVSGGGATYNSAGTLAIQDSADGRRNIWIGYDPNLELGWIQPLINGVAYKPLLLNPNGGAVGIAKTNPGYTLDVTGDVNCTGAFRVNGTPIGAGGITTKNIVTGSRGLGTTYQNNTGKPMFVTIPCLIAAGGSYVQLLTDAGNPPSAIASAATNSAPSTGATLTVSAWILPGHYYQAATPGGVTISSWNEWT